MTWNFRIPCDITIRHSGFFALVVQWTEMHLLKTWTDFGQTICGPLCILFVISCDFK